MPSASIGRIRRASYGLTARAQSSRNLPRNISCAGSKIGEGLSICPTVSWAATAHCREPTMLSNLQRNGVEKHPDDLEN